MNRPSAQTRVGEVLRMKDVARYLNCHPSTIYRLVARREIPHFRLGSDLRFRKSAIDDWIDEQNVPAKNS